MTFYNTIESPGADLKKYEDRAYSMQEKVLEVFRRQPGRRFTPIEIALDHLHLKQHQIVSVRRAISDLSNPDKFDPPLLIKTDTKRMERFGTSNFAWQYRKPIYKATQKTLFE